MKSKKEIYNRIMEAASQMVIKMLNEVRNPDEYWIDHSKWIEVEGSKCYNLDSYKFCLCKKSVGFKDKPGIAMKSGLVYICCLDKENAVTIFGRGVSHQHYTVDRISQEYYSK